LINELASKGNRSSLSLWLILLISLTFLINLLAALVRRWKLAEEALVSQYLRRLYSNKFLDMDFKSVDSARTKELYAQIQQNDNWSSWGMRKSLYTGEKAMTAIFTILGSMILSLNLFLTPMEKSTSGFYILDTWYFAFIFLMLVV